MSESPHYLVLALYVAKDGETENVLELLNELANASRQEPDNISYDYYRKVETSNEILIVETYTSEEGFARHRETEHFRRLAVGNIIGRLENRVISSYNK